MTTNTPVSINVESEYLKDHSEPLANRHVFAYTVTISNHGIENVQLLSRHWLITDGKNKVQEVKGEGVIGEQPTIKPGSQFSYTSSAMLETSTGTMEGSYQMLSQSGENFDTPIPLFMLSRPGALH
jgi:ApaG protein